MHKNKFCLYLKMSTEVNVPSSLLKTVCVYRCMSCKKINVFIQQMHEG
jgi:hypothetical protein